MNSNLYKIHATKELTTMPNPALAKDLLERLIATTAKVVLNRKWSVKILKEFYPKNSSLLGLNVNAGSSIMIRLREAKDMQVFLPWNSILGTMIHELIHNEIGEHSAEFYTLMDKVYDEVEACMMSSSSSSSFQLYNNKDLGNHNDINSSKIYTFDGKYFKAKASVTISNGTNDGISLKEQIAIATISRFDEAEKKKKKIKDLTSLSKYRKLDYDDNNMKSNDSYYDSEQFNNINRRNKDRLLDDLKGCSLSDWQSIDELNENIINDWICMICNLNNIMNISNDTNEVSISCNWCGCPYGSTPIEASKEQVSNSSCRGSSNSSTYMSSSSSGSSDSSRSGSSSSGSSSRSRSSGKENTYNPFNSNDDNIVYLDISPPPGSSKLPNNIFYTNRNYCKPCTKAINNNNNDNNNKLSFEQDIKSYLSVEIGDIVVDLTSDDIS